MPTIRPRRDYDPPVCCLCKLDLPAVGTDRIAVEGAHRYHWGCYSRKAAERDAAASDVAQQIPHAKNGRVTKSGKPDS